MSFRGVLLGLGYLCLIGMPSFIAGQEPIAPPAAVIPIRGIENLRQVTPHILCGSQPELSASFEALARRGVKVIISVDGAAPAIDEAHKHGLHYVHVPIGYGKITPQQRADLVEAVKSSDGLVFIHCHHGRHRGPAAAGYCGMAMGELSQVQGLQLLKAAGTRQDYTGLWDAIRQFEAPTVPSGKLVEVADVEPMVAAMVRIDHHWTGLEKSLNAGPVPNAELKRELLLLTEEFRELPRVSQTKDEDLKQHMQLAQAAAELLLKSVESGASASEQMAAAERVTQRCADCHAKHRQ